jgi:DNA-directed RNA polymerase subunit E"
MAKKMCKKCKRLVLGDKCPICQTDKLNETWKGRVIIIDASESIIAEKMKIDAAGEYALR